MVRFRMKSTPIHRWRLTLCTLTAIFAISGAIWFFAYHWDPRPEWLARIDASHQPFDAAVLALGGPDVVALDHKIWKEVLRRPMWDTGDVDELWAIHDTLDQPLSSYPDDTPKPEVLSILVRQGAQAALHERFFVEAPVTPAARERYVSLLHDDMFHGNRDRRINAALALMELGFLEEPGIRGAVERLLDDSDEYVRTTVALQLGYYDEKKSRVAALENRRKKAGQKP